MYFMNGKTVLEIQIHKLQGFYIMFTKNVINLTLGVVRRHFSSIQIKAKTSQRKSIAGI